MHQYFHTQTVEENAEEIKAALLKVKEAMLEAAKYADTLEQEKGFKSAADYVDVIISDDIQPIINVIQREKEDESGDDWMDEERSMYRFNQI